MTDSTKGQKGGDASAQPLDPSQNAQDFFSDPTGRTGVTTDETKNVTGGRLTDDMYNDEEYDKSTQRGMSATKAEQIDELASEEEKTPTPTELLNSDKEPYLVNRNEASGNDSPGSDENNTASAGYSQPEHLGEQSISGSAPDPTADDDTLAAAQAMGTQLNEDEEHPQELNIAGDFDKAEESLKHR